MYSDLKIVLMKKPQPFMEKINIKKWNYPYPLDQKLIDNNYNEFKNIIIKFGTKIIELDLKNENSELCDSIFTHDPSLVTFEGAIILNMTKNLRKIETKFHLDIYKNLNIPIIGQLEHDENVEGGDCLWINDSLLLVGKSDRTNLKGINKLKNILNRFNIETIPISLPKIPNYNCCFHLMSTVSILDKDLIIGYRKFLENSFFEILKKNKIKFIDIPEDEYFKSQTLAVNILALSPRNLILMKEHNKTCETLLNENCNINVFSGSELCIKLQGGPTCLTRAILRK